MASAIGSIDLQVVGATVMAHATSVLSILALVLALHHSERRAGVFETVLRVLLTAATWLWITREGRRIDVSMSLSLTDGAVSDRVGFLCVGQDVSRQREIQRTLAEALETERVAIRQLRDLDDAKDEFVSTVSHELRTPTTSIVGYVVGDAAQIDRVITNLVSNAIKFTEDDGRIDVTLERQDDEAVLTVSDTGIGIPDADCEKVFQRFYRTATAQQRAIQGTGLGLAIVASIVEGHQRDDRTDLAGRSGHDGGRTPSPSWADAVPGGYG